MDVENLPNMKPLDFGLHVDPRRPILAGAWTVKGAHRIAAHQHARAHIIYPTRGTYWVVTPQGSWVVPANQAVWIPSQVYHEVFSNDSMSAQLLFVDPAYCDSLPRECVVLNVSPFLRELINKAVANGNDYVPEGREARLVRVLLDELAAMTPAPLHLPLSHDKRLRRFMRALIECPADDRSFEELACEAGASTRTLARLFSKDTGKTFGEWRKQLRLLEAVDRLGQGYTVTRVALDLGYSSASAFIAMFRRTLGVPPGRYVQVRDPQRNENGLGVGVTE